MNNTVTNIIMFAAGAVVASAVTWKIAKTKYERVAEKEINEVKEYYNKKAEKERHEESTPREPIEKPSLTEYAKKLNELSYSVGVDISEEGEPVMKGRPYVISPDEFGENDYETISLTYYADKVLTDEQDYIVENIDEMIGYDSLTHFGEYEEDSVFVRNDALEIDYEILAVTRNYHDDIVSPVEE